MEKDRDLIERLKLYYLGKLGQLQEFYNLVEHRDCSPLDLRKRFEHFPIHGKEIDLLLELSSRCDGNAGQLFSQACKERVEEYLKTMEPRRLISEGWNTYRN